MSCAGVATPSPRRDAGSVLLLVPASVLVVLLLAAIAVDQAQVFLRQRQAHSVAVDVANDLATAALDEAAFRSTGEYRLDPRRAEALGQELVRSSDVGPLVVDVSIAVPAGDEVVVELAVRVEHIFTRAMPGGSDATVVRARAAAAALPGP